MLTKRMMETPLPEPPMVEPDRTSAKRRRRTRYTPLPGNMENATHLTARITTRCIENEDPKTYRERMVSVRNGTDDGHYDGFW